jgi:hypothetical protein
MYPYIFRLEDELEEMPFRIVDIEKSLEDEMVLIQDFSNVN